MKVSEISNPPLAEEEIDSTCEAMTILHIFSGDLWAGAEVMIFHLLDELRKKPGIKIVALSLNEGILTEKLRKANIETYMISETEHSFARILLKSYQLLKGRTIQIIHSHRYKENLIAIFLAKLIGVKCLVSTLHGLPEPPLQAKNRPARIGLKTKVNYFLLKQFFTHVVAVSQEINHVLVQKYRFNQERVDVVYNGISLPQTPSSCGDSKETFFHIGTVGRMVPVKDLNLFLEVAADIRKQTDRVRFSILGDGPLREALIRKAKELKIEGCVEFLEPRPDPVPGYYHSLDLYLNTSFHEGIPLSILEAMACGLPVVAPKVGGIPEIILDGEQGFLIEGRDPKEFSNRCMMLFQDKKLRTLLGENGAKRISSCFSKSIMAASYLVLYQRPSKRQCVSVGVEG
jgi:glycosyltransferase involved in cell wall biosynthesis